MYLYLLNVSTRNSGVFDVFVLLNPSAYIEIAQVQLPKEIAVKRTLAIVMLFMYLYIHIFCVLGGGMGRGFTFYAIYAFPRIFIFSLLHLFHHSYSQFSVFTFLLKRMLLHVFSLFRIFMKVQ